MHTGVGFYGKDAADGGSRNVHLSGFAIHGDVRERIDTDQVNGIGGALSDSTIDGLYIQHTKVGLWFDGPMNNLTVTQQRHRRPDRRRAELPHRRHQLGRVEQLRAQHRRRRPGHVGGDDRRTPATRSTTTRSRRRRSPTASRSTAAPTTRSSGNLVADPIREGSGLQVGSRFGAEPFTGHLWITDNTTVRAGTYELNWNIGLGAIWFYALEKNIDADIQVVGDHFLDNTYNAIMLVADWPVKDLYSITNVHFKDIRVDGTGTSVLSARAAGSATFENVDARNVGAVGINNCGSFNFTPTGSEFVARSTSAATTAAAPPVRGSRRGSCRTPSPATTARRSSRRRRRRPGERVPRRGGRHRRAVRVDRRARAPAARTRCAALRAARRARYGATTAHPCGATSDRPRVSSSVASTSPPGSASGSSPRFSATSSASSPSRTS